MEKCQKLIVGKTSLDNSLNVGKDMTTFCRNILPDNFDLYEKLKYGQFGIFLSLSSIKSIL